MTTLSMFATALVITLHVLFLIMEMFLWNTAFGRKTFGLSRDYAVKTAPLMANQGLYNGFLAAGLLWGLFAGRTDILLFFLCCIIIAGIFGAISVKPAIFWIQALPATIATLLLIYS